MSNFITKDDYKFRIQDKRLNMLLEDDDSILIDPEDTAIQFVRDALHNYYDVDVIFATTGDDRPKNVLWWCTSIALYFVYQRIPDKLIPDRVEKDYEITLDALLNISDGQRSVELPLKPSPDGEVTTKFRWGSREQRTY